MHLQRSTYLVDIIVESLPVADTLFSTAQDFSIVRLYLHNVLCPSILYDNSAWLKLLILSSPTDLNKSRTMFREKSHWP